MFPHLLFASSALINSPQQLTELTMRNIDWFRVVVYTGILLFCAGCWAITIKAILRLIA